MHAAIYYNNTSRARQCITFATIRPSRQQKNNVAPCRAGARGPLPPPSPGSYPPRGLYPPTGHVPRRVTSPAVYISSGGLYPPAGYIPRRVYAPPAPALEPPHCAAVVRHSLRPSPRDPWVHCRHGGAEWGARTLTHTDTMSRAAHVRARCSKAPLCMLQFACTRAECACVARAECAWLARASARPCACMCARARACMCARRAWGEAVLVCVRCARASMRFSLLGRFSRSLIHKSS